MYQPSFILSGTETNHEHSLDIFQDYSRQSQQLQYMKWQDISALDGSKHCMSVTGLIPVWDAQLATTPPTYTIKGV